MKRTTQSELRVLLTDLGVAAGDKVFIHAFIPSLGIIEGGIVAITNVILELLEDDGTLIVPTFTASYRREKIYDVKRSISYNGALSEYVRKLPNAVRSIDPLFSMAAVGKDANILMERPGKACFGHGSVYEKLFQNDVKFLGFGIQWDQGFSFFVHLERLGDVPYRQDTTYQGRTRLIDGTLVDDEAIHFVRREDYSWERRRGPVCDQLLAQGKIYQITQNGCSHRLFEAATVKSAVLDLLKDDPWCMTDHAIL